MPTHENAVFGSPCSADLWTSDLGSRGFYGELFGWEVQEPSPEFGGYFMFTRDGVPVAGGMGDMGDMPAQDVWKIYLATDDIAKTVAAAERARALRAARDELAARLTPPYREGHSRRGATCSTWNLLPIC
jgi:hypothetical protein